MSRLAKKPEAEAKFRSGAGGRAADTPGESRPKGRSSRRSQRNGGILRRPRRANQDTGQGPCVLIGKGAGGCRGIPERSEDRSRAPPHKNENGQASHNPVGQGTGSLSDGALADRIVATTGGGSGRRMSAERVEGSSRRRRAANLAILSDYGGVAGGGP